MLERSLEEMLAGVVGILEEVLVGVVVEEVVEQVA